MWAGLVVLSLTTAVCISNNNAKIVAVSPLASGASEVDPSKAVVILPAAGQGVLRKAPGEVSGPRFRRSGPVEVEQQQSFGAAVVPYTADQMDTGCCDRRWVIWGE